MEGFQKLPLELLPDVLKHLPLGDLKNARLVSREFKFAVTSCGFFHHVSFQLPNTSRILQPAPKALEGYHVMNKKLQGQREVLSSVIGWCLAILDRLQQYRTRDWLQHITVESAALLPLTEALDRFGLYDLSKLTVILDFSQFGEVLVAAFIHSIVHLYPDVFANVKDLSVDVKDILNGSFSLPFSYLVIFMATKTRNLERLTIKTSLEHPALHSTSPLLTASRYSLFNYRNWEYLHTLHLSGLVLEIVPFTNLIHKQPSLEIVLLQKLNLSSLNPIPDEFDHSAWIWFFSEFGKVDNRCLREQVGDPTEVLLDVWAKTQFYVDRLCTEHVIEDCESWEFPNVKMLSEYDPNGED